MERHLECVVCSRDWDATECVPRVQKCGHTCCESCLKGMYKTTADGKGKVTCPMCNAEHLFKSCDDINDLPKIYDLIYISEQQKKLAELIQSKEQNPVKREPGSQTARMGHENKKNEDFRDSWELIQDTDR